MRVDWLIAGSNSVRLFDEQLRRVMRLPESPTQLAQLHERTWGVQTRRTVSCVADEDGASWASLYY
jgi:hypothetical protein